MIASIRPTARHRLRLAEAVLPGHPDKLADQVADAIVDVAIEQDERAIVQVEVAVHDANLHVNGRCSTLGQPLDVDLLQRTARAVYERIGFGESFPGCGPTLDYQCPRPADVRIHWTAQVDTSDPIERDEREFTDDQALNIGYAIADPETRHLPLEQHLALALRDELATLSTADRTLGAGPDGKVIIALEEESATRTRLLGVTTSVQHLEAASTLRLERAVRQALWSRLEREAAAFGNRRLVLDVGDEAVRVNPSGIFTVGGPMNDNGQTGRKNVVDFYGPRVPIGGGALSGKDPWRLDRAGALRARQIAVAIVQTGFVHEAQVTFGWSPRDRRPSWVEILADGHAVDARTRDTWLRRYDPSLAATWEELALARVNWETCARIGHFGGSYAWERAGVGV
jgi:S-adenosylmethionine synthetase